MTIMTHLRSHFPDWEIKTTPIPQSMMLMMTAVKDNRTISFVNTSVHAMASELMLALSKEVRNGTC